MNAERFNPLNDYLFLKVMGEKGDEEQLLSFLNAVLKRRGNEQLQSVEIIENRALPADIIGGKASVLDVLAKTGDNTRVDVEVQLRNLGNMDRRSLFYWSREFSKGLASGQEYGEAPNTIAVNIVGYEFLPQIPEYQTTFHIWEDRHREILLTDALEIHFIDMVKFRAAKERDLENDPLQRWLTYLDRESPKELVEEVMKMDIAIGKAGRKMAYVTQDEETRRIYEMREKALSDWTSGVNQARREGLREGEAKGRVEEQMEIARRMKARGRSIEEIAGDTGLPEAQIKEL